MTNQEAIARARKTIDKCMFPSLATVDETGCPQMRAMMSVMVDDDLTTYYITSRMSAKCSHIAKNPYASSLWTDVLDPMKDWRSVLVKGKAEVTDDKELREKFWTEELRGFFPGGVADPNYVIIVIKPTEMILADNQAMPPVTIKL